MPAPDQARRAARGCTAAVTITLALAAGCGKDILDAHDVEVTAVGNPSAITVTLEWPGGSESLSLAPDATGTFASQMATGTAITLRSPTDCRFGNGDVALGVTTADRLTQVRVGCPDTLELTSLGLPAPFVATRLALAFDILLGALAIEPNPVVTVRPVARYPGATFELNNVGNGDGDLTNDRLRLGNNTLKVTAAEFLTSRDYTVHLGTAAGAKERGRVAGATASGGFGAAVAAQGDLVVVGEPGAAFGRAYVYRANRGATGTTWQLEATLEPGAAAGVGSGYGEAIALAGDLLAIGAPRDGVDDYGAVYVYSRQGSTWSLARRLSFNLTGSRFGAAVALGAGGMMVVGAPGTAGGGGANAGAAYIYASATSGSYVNAGSPHPDPDDELGVAVAIVGSTVLIGAPGDDDGSASAATPPMTDANNLTDAGAVYAFSSAGAITRYLKQTAPAAGARFGARLAARGAQAVAVARAKPMPAVDCYSEALSPRGSIDVGRDIAALALDSDRIAVAHLASETGPALQVSAYRLKSDASSPAAIAPAFGGSGVIATDQFGRSVAFGGDSLYVGAPGQGATAAGAFYVFE